MTISSSELCLGRALAFTFGSFSHIMDVSIDTLPKEGVKDIESGLTVNRCIVTDYDALETVFFDSILDVGSDMVIIKLYGDVGIPSHDVMILVVNKGFDSLVFYRNSWGYDLDTKEYKRMDKEHPIKKLARLVSIPHVIFVLPEDSMIKCGAQHLSEECSRRDNSIEICVADRNLGACVSWNDMYIKKIQDWLRNKRINFGFEDALPEIKSQLVEIDSSLVFGDESLTKISEYGAKRWAKSPFIPYEMLREIFDTIPSSLSEIQFKTITNSYDKFMGNIPESGDHETLLPEASLFLKESLGYELLVRDSYKLTGICDGLKIKIGTYSCGEFIIDMVMVLIACKNRTMSDEISSGKRKLSMDNIEPRKTFRRATSFIDL